MIRLKGKRLRIIGGCENGRRLLGAVGGGAAASEWIPTDFSGSNLRLELLAG